MEQGGERWSCHFSSRMFGIEVFVLLKKIISFFLNFSGHAGSSLLCAGFSAVVESGVTLQLPPSLRSTGSRHAGLSGCASWAQ